MHAEAGAVLLRDAAAAAEPGGGHHAAAVEDADWRRGSFVGGTEGGGGRGLLEGDARRAPSGQAQWTPRIVVETIWSRPTQRVPCQKSHGRSGSSEKTL